MEMGGGVDVSRLCDGSYWFVSHVKSPHELEDGDLEGEVERRDDAHWTVRPAVSGDGFGCGYDG